MKVYSRGFFIFAVIALLLSCDPPVYTEYAIINNSSDSISMTIYGLKHSDNGLPKDYTKTILIGERSTIYIIGSLGFPILNDADTIVVFDSIDIRKSGRSSVTNFKWVTSWVLNAKKFRTGGGTYSYELLVRNKDF
jgi:hypothetical protein